MQTENIKLPGYEGTFYVIDSEPYYRRTLYLLESEIYGEDAYHIIIDDHDEIILDDVVNGFDDFYDYVDCYAEPKQIKEWSEKR